jgi:DNA repair protein RadC
MPRPKYQPSLFDQEMTTTATTPGIAGLRETSQTLKAKELICAVTGLTPAQADELLKRAGSVHQLARLPEHALMSLPHIGRARAKQLRAMTEWACLLSESDSAQQPQVNSPVDVANMFMLDMGLLEREQLRVVGLDTKNKVSFVDTVYQGSLNSAVVRVSEVLREPIARQCAGMVMVHNHPSGDPTPSPEDVQVTHMVREGGKLFDIDLIDHIIIGLNRFVSMKERGLGFG